MNFYLKLILFIIILLLLFFFINSKNYNEHFLGKVTLEKKLIVILMENDISKKYKGSIKTLCNSVINNCTYDFNKEKIGKSKKVNITFDKSLKTSTKNDDCNYVVLYKKSDLNDNNNSSNNNSDDDSSNNNSDDDSSNNNSDNDDSSNNNSDDDSSNNIDINNYKNKFYKKWCSKSKKEKDNYIVIDYDDISNDKERLLDELEKKFKVNIPMKGLLNMGSMNNLDTLIQMKDLLSNSSNSSNSNNTMEDLYNEFLNKI